MKKGIVVILIVLALLSLLLPELYPLGKISGMNVYFYRGNFIFSSEACFLQNGELMRYQGLWGSRFGTVGVFFIVAILSAILSLIHIIEKCVKRRRDKRRAA